MGFIELKTKLKYYSKTKSFWLYLGFFLLIAGIFIANSLHESYPDEFDNILGGWYIIHGKFIYKDWFTHHGPVSYVISALINLFAFHSFVRFRELYGVFLVIMTFGSFWLLSRRLKGINLSFYWYFILLLALSATYFWGHMLLADNVSAFFLLPIFALVFLKSVNERLFDQKDYVWISIFSALALMSALTYAFLVAGLYFYLVVYYFVRKGKDYDLIDVVKMIATFIVPYLIFLIYLVLTGALGNYYQDAIKFNREFYIYYPGLEGKPPSNPLRYAIVIAEGFSNNFLSLITQIKSFNFEFPFNIALAVSNLVLGVYLLLKRKYLTFLFVLGMFIYANARTNPMTSRETDYQSAVYIMFSLFATAYIIPTLYKEINSNVDHAKRLIFSGLFILVVVYSVFNFAFILRKFSYKTYDKYMGFASLIYDRPAITPFINKFETKNDYAWIGPFAYQDLYYLNAKLPSTYQVFLPGMGHLPRIENKLISDINRNKPDVIYFDKDYYILGASPKDYGHAFLDYLNDNYITLGDYQREGVSYNTNYDPSLIMSQKLYINKEKADAVVDKMINADLVFPQ